jgi:hypothetical protein
MTSGRYQGLLGSIPEIPPRRLGKSLHAFSRTKASLKQSAFLHGLDPSRPHQSAAGAAAFWVAAD